MLYLLRPDRSTRWIDLPEQILNHALGEDALARLPWQETTDLTFVNDDLLRMAVRHGAPCSSGIVLRARHCVEHDRANKLLQTHRQTQRSLAALRRDQGPLLEQLMPGWTKNSEELDQKVSDSVLAAYEEAVEDFAEELAANKPVDALVAHWLSLGGTVPDPL